MGGDRNTINGFAIMNNTLNGQMLITFAGCENHSIGNGIFYNSTVTDALYLNGNNTIVSNVTFWDIGTSDGDIDNAIVIDSDNNCIINCTFRGIIDDYCIDIFSGEINNTVANCTAFNLTNNIGFLIDNSGNTTNQYYGNLTDDANYFNITLENEKFNGYVQFKSSTTVGLQGTIPDSRGHVYMHATSPGICISTGTLIGQFGYIPVQSLP